MDESFWIGQSLRHLADAEALYRHGSRVITDEFNEVRHLWPDQRGRTFAAAHIESQLASIADAALQLRGQADAAHSALRAANLAETHTRLCQAALAEHEQQAKSARRLCATSFDLAGRVSVAAGELTAAANSIDARIAQLLA
jgi:hypothetical protein